jgi:hypothetical protein
VATRHNRNIRTFMATLPSRPPSYGGSNESGPSLRPLKASLGELLEPVLCRTEWPRSTRMVNIASLGNIVREILLEACSATATDLRSKRTSLAASVPGHRGGVRTAPVTGSFPKQAMSQILGMPVARFVFVLEMQAGFGSRQRVE